MTLAREQRNSNHAVALKTMLDAVGDDALDEMSFAPIAYPKILATTWDELISIGLVEMLPTGAYMLTGHGWTAALISTHGIYDASFKDRLGKLLAALKGYVKGREESVIVPFRTIVDQTGLPEGWIFNIIDGRYMEELSHRRGASWVKPGRLVLIPVAFGIESTDLRTLLDPTLLQKVETLEEERDATLNELSRYRCPYCNSELTSAGGYPLDEHNEGDYENFACGYSLQNGYPWSLCPKDPNYPKFEDFELIVEQNKNGEWICHANGKTRYAKLVNLQSCPGRTEEEARRRVAARYYYAAGKKGDITDLW